MRLLGETLMRILRSFGSFGSGSGLSNLAAPTMRAVPRPAVRHALWTLVLLTAFLASTAVSSQPPPPAPPTDGAEAAPPAPPRGEAPAPPEVDSEPAEEPEAVAPAEEAQPPEERTRRVPRPAVEAVREEALEEIDRALEEVEDRIEQDLERADEQAAEAGALTSEQIRARRERMREVREEVRRRLREHTDRSDNKVAFGSSIRIGEGEVARDLVAIGGSIDVEGDVYGDVVAIGGPVDINGRITGDVVAVGGGVDLGSEAEVLGEITSVGGKVRRAEGAEVLGRINEVAFGPNFTWNVGDADIHWWDWRQRRGFSPFRFEWFGFALSLTGVVVLLLLASLVRLVAGGTVERVRAKAVESPWMCGLVGLAVELFFLPVLVVVTLILVISIIGIPLVLLIPFVILALLMALIVGYTGAALAVGDWAQQRFGGSAASPFVSIAIGVLLIQTLHVIAELFDSFDGFLWVFALMFGVAGFLVRYAAWTVGLGAVFLTGVRSPSRAAALPPPPPTYGDAPLPPTVPPPTGDRDWSGQPFDDSATR